MKLLLTVVLGRIANSSDTYSQNVFYSVTLIGEYDIPQDGLLKDFLIDTIKVAKQKQDPNLCVISVSHSIVP